LHKYPKTKILLVFTRYKHKKWWFMIACILEQYVVSKSIQLQHDFLRMCLLLANQKRARYLFIEKLEVGVFTEPNWWRMVCLEEKGQSNFQKRKFHQQKVFWFQTVSIHFFCGYTLSEVTLPFRGTFSIVQIKKNRTTYTL
jgi:hypothetical protein